LILVSIPLLRRAGWQIVTEPLTQAERDVIYEIWDFERYKRPSPSMLSPIT
jgi:hypothetical protein